MAKKNTGRPSPPKPGGYDPKRKTLDVRLYGRAQRPDYKTILRSSFRRAMLKTHYPSSLYAPDPACRFCRGSGEVKKGERFKACICIYVLHSAIPAVLAALQKAADEPEAIAQTLELTGLDEWDHLVAQK